MNNAYLLSFPSHGSEGDGQLTVFEKSSGVPFEIKRVYTVAQTKYQSVRGHHAHKTLKQLFVASCGTIRVDCEDQTGQREQFVLDRPDLALYCGPGVWHTLVYENNAVLLVLASAEYEEADYIRSYEEFKERRNGQ